MGCTGCAVKKLGKDDAPTGCNSHGSCGTGGCNRMNTYNWLSNLPIGFNENDNLYEITFNNGSRKDYFRNDSSHHYDKHDWVIVESKTGYDIGQVSLRGELVTIQMKKKKVRTPKNELQRLLRAAQDRDLEKMIEVKGLEQQTMIKARVIARDLKLNMKIGQVEYQSDGKKATFYYIADGRVDFRELIKQYAYNFRVKIEMRQIGARQEAGKIGGIGPCGRELCCSTWLNNFKSVSTTAARYQNLAINQSKLSGQCGRLKCCLNYELDSYLDALQHFPKKADYLKVTAGEARLIKTDIFKGLMWYGFKGEPQLHKLTIERVNEVLQANKKGEFPETLLPEQVEEDEKVARADTLEDGSGMLTLETLERTSRRNKRKNRRNRKSQGPKKNPNNKGNSSNQKSRKPANRSNSNRSQKPNSNLGNKPNSKPNNNTNKTSNKPNNKPNNNSNNKPKNKPNNNSNSKANKNPNSKPNIRSNNKPNNKPSNKPNNSNNSNKQNQPKQQVTNKPKTNKPPQSKNKNLNRNSNSNNKSKQ